jgi:hypothetical protein
MDLEAVDPMTAALAGALTRTTDILNTALADAVSDTTIGTVATGWSVSAQQSRTLLGGKLIFVDVALTRTGAGITATAGDIADTLCFTLDAAYWPSEAVVVPYRSTTLDGMGGINTDGTITLYTASATIATSATIRLSVTYIIA